MSRPRKPVSEPIETEAKIRVASLTPIRRRLAASGARRVSPRTAEINTLYDAPDGTLRAQGKSFRLRRYGRQGVLTLKGAATVARGLKSRVELETEVESPETLASILISLGFVAMFRYEKFRETWSLGRVAICLDDTPLGAFVEIEGTGTSIHRVARKLSLGRHLFLGDSYPALWVAAGKTGDMVFKPGKRA